MDFDTFLCKREIKKIIRLLNNKHIDMNKLLFCILSGVLLLTSCTSSKKILYLQDVVYNQPETIKKTKDIILQPKDMISILVSCKEPQLASMFNLSAAGGGENSSLSGYTLDDNGDIELPVLGKLHVGGMSKIEVSQLVKQRLIEEDYIKDPVVTVEFMNLHFSVLGEVASPGNYDIKKDQLNLLEAISMAGDLTITGKRDMVMVTREENNQRNIYKVDLRSKELFNSPVYYLKQNDIIYVQPNKKRADESSNDVVRYVSLWLGIVSVLTSISILIFK